MAALLFSACGDNTAPAPPASPKIAPRLIPTTAPGFETTTSVATSEAATPTIAPPRPNPTITPTVGPTIAPSNGKFSPELAYSHVKELAEKIGSRPAGSDNELKAAQYIESYFARLGLQSNRLEVSYANFEDKGSKLNYAGAAGKIEIKGDAAHLTGTGNVNGSLVYTGFGMSGQIGPNSLKGKIALMQRGEVSFKEKVENAIAGGAIGVVVFNDRDGPLNTVTLGKLFNIPVLGLARDDGEKLKQEINQAGSKGLEVNLEVQASTVVRKLYNVIGTRPAKEGGSTASVLVIGGHFDTLSNLPGANANASGVGVMLELAHALASKYPKYELRFIAFGGGESGLIGSSDYAQNLGDTELKRIIAMINLDMLGVGSTLYIGGDENLSKAAFSAAKNSGANDVQPASARLVNNSDQTPFAQVGVPTLIFSRGEDSNYRQPGDTADKVQPELLSLPANSVIKVIDGLAGN